MPIRILCHSHTGNTRAACRVLAGKLNAEMDEITAPAPNPGILSTALLIARSLLSRGPAVRVPARDWAAADLVILGAPVWAGRLALPMRQWLETGPALPAKVALVVTSGGPDLPEAVTEEFRRATGRAPLALLHLSDADRAEGTDAAKLAAFAETCAAAADQPVMA